MTHFIENGNIIFELNVGKRGHSIDLGDVSVLTEPNGPSVTFRCEYPVDVTLTSNAFLVRNVSASGTQTSTGSLSAGFSIILSQGCLRTNSPFRGTFAYF